MEKDVDNDKIVETTPQYTHDEMIAFINELRFDSDFADKFNKLTRVLHSTAVEKGWWNPGKSVPEQLVMMHSEISEALEEYRKEDNGVHSFYYSGAEEKPEGFGVELADLGIRMLDTCGAYDLDLLNFICKKALFNLTRSYRHGNKKV